MYGNGSRQYKVAATVLQWRRVWVVTFGIWLSHVSSSLCLMKNHQQWYDMHWRLNSIFAIGTTVSITQLSYTFLVDLNTINDTTERCIKDMADKKKLANDKLLEDILLVVSSGWAVFQDLCRDAFARIQGWVNLIRMDPCIFCSIYWPSQNSINIFGANWWKHV